MGLLGAIAVSPHRETGSPEVESTIVKGRVPGTAYPVSRGFDKPRFRFAQPTERWGCYRERKGDSMQFFDPIKPAKRPRIGLYSIGHPHYWEQFPGLLDRLLGYGEFLNRRIGAWGDVCYGGMVDQPPQAQVVAEQFNACNVDLIFCHAATYAMSASHLAIAPLPASVGRAEFAADGRHELRPDDNR